MKNLLKKINVFGLALILAAGAVFVTQSAFKSANVSQLYGYDPTHIYSSNTWYPLNDKIEGENEGDYLCSGDEGICSAEFENAPDNTTPPPAETREGTFSIVQ